MTTKEVEEAEYWKARYEQERERLVKLWVAYKTLEAELGRRLPPEPQPST